MLGWLQHRKGAMLPGSEASLNRPRPPSSPSQLQTGPRNGLGVGVYSLRRNRSRVYTLSKRGETEATRVYEQGSEEAQAADGWLGWILKLRGSSTVYVHTMPGLGLPLFVLYPEHTPGHREKKARGKQVSGCLISLCAPVCVHKYVVGPFMCTWDVMYAYLHT